MFDIGFTELLICGLIALIVLGPERLPRLAQRLGRFTGQARAYLRNLNAELERELHTQEIRAQLDEARRAVDAGVSEARSALDRAAGEGSPSETGTDGAIESRTGDGRPRD